MKLINLFKRSLLWIGLAMWSFALVWAPAFANQGGGWLGGDFDVPTDGNNTFTNTTNSAQWVWVARSGEQDVDGAGGLIRAVKTAINWVLWLLALIALIIALWAWFQMLTAAGDDGKYKKWFTMLRQAAIGLIMIGISWLLVSFIFWVINTVTWT